MQIRYLAFILSFLFLQTALAEGICYPLKEECWPRTPSSSNPAYPSSTAGFQINPSAIPLENKFGFEMLNYNSENDFGIVRGLGRVGAALSPSNAEETFFGPIGFEYNSAYLERKIAQRKYLSQKMTLATAVGLFTNRRSGLDRMELNVGLLGKYNKISKITHPGMGLMAILGPFQIGYTFAKDQFYQEEPDLIDVSYQQSGYSLGINLNSLALDYSKMSTRVDNYDYPITIQLTTGSILLKRWIITAASRVETSERLEFVRETGSLEYNKTKHSSFYGVQFAVLKSLLVGVFYNYYQLDEFSTGLTVFF